MNKKQPVHEHQSRFSVRLIPALTLGIQTLLLGGNEVNHSLQWMPRATLKSPSSVMLLVHDKNTHQRSYLWWCHGNNLHFLSLTLRCCVCGGGAFRVAHRKGSSLNHKLAWPWPVPHQHFCICLSQSFSRSEKINYPPLSTSLTGKSTLSCRLSLKISPDAKLQLRTASGWFGVI